MKRILASLIASVLIASPAFGQTPTTSTPPQAPAVAEARSTPPSLSLGDRGPAVKKVQRALTKAGWPTVADGVFGPITDRTVRAFQKANGLPVDGVVGSRTRKALRINSGVTTSVPPIRIVDRYIHPNPDVDRWWDEALRAGWSLDQWPVVACIMEHPIYKGTAESRGIPTVHNTRYPDNSYGLLQLNMRAHSSWAGPMVGWDFNRLFDGETNLRVAHRLWELAGGSFSHWRSTQERATCFAMEGQR